MDHKHDNIFNSLKGITPASPSQFFYSGIIKKLNTVPKNIWEQWSAFIVRPAVLAAGFILIVLLNVATIIISGKQQSDDQQASSNVEEVEQFIYSTSAYFDYESSTP